MFRSLPFRLLRSHRRLLALFASASVGRAAIAGATILLVREFLGGILGRREGAAGRLAETWGPEAALWALAASLLVATLAGAALTYASRLAQQRLVKAIELGVLERLIGTLLGLSAAFHDRRTRGDLLQTVQQDVTHLRTVVLAGGTLVLDAMHAIALGGAAVILSPRLGLLAFLLLPLAAAPIYLLARRAMNRSIGVRRRSVVLLDMLFQLLAGIRVLRIYHGEDAEGRRAIDRARRYHDELVALERVRALGRVTLESVAGAGLVIVIIVGGFLVLDGSLGWPELLAFLMAVRASHTPLHNINANIIEIQRHAASVAAIDALLQERPDVHDRPGARPLTDPPRRISAAHLGYSAGGTSILDDVSFEVRAGETLGVVGASGAGKTTLLNLVARFYDPDAGEVRYDDADLRDLQIGSVHRHLAIVMQEPFLFSTTIRENIRCGRPGAPDRDVEEAARTAGIHSEIEAMPDGYETLVGQGARQLSRGEAQRICIARAILKDAPVLLLDEATSSLDPAAEDLVQAALDRLSAGRLTIAVAHRPSALRRATRILVLDSGRVAGLGTHDALMRDCPAYRRLRQTPLDRPEGPLPDLVQTASGAG
jgi:ABC-type multidrug transport system fused ATPase/permease subunit